MRVSSAAPAITLILTAGLIGCGVSCDSKVVEQVQEQAKQVRTAATKVVEEVKKKTIDTGNFEINVDVPIQVKNCYATLVPLGPGRSSVWQITSYSKPEVETFPSMMFHAAVSEQTPQELVGKTVSGQMFVQLKQDGGLWRSLADQPVQVTIQSVQDGACEAQIVSGQLVDTESGKQVDLTGKFTAVVAQ